MSVLGFFLALALCAGLGRSVLGCFADETDPPSSRWVLALAAGILFLHVWLNAIQLVGLRWTAPAILASAAAALVLWRLLPRPPAAAPEPGWVWGDAVAIAAIALFGYLALTGWAMFPDFVFHWGVKAERFALAGGVDWEFLARPWNWAVHPDYPNAVPELYAASAILGRGFREPVMLAWSVVVLLLIVIAARAALAVSGVGDRSRGGATALLAALLAAYGIRGYLAGSSDWNIALAPLLAWPALTGAPSARRDARVALAAAFAAASKIEGVPLAALLVGVALARRAWIARRLEPLAILRCAALPLLIVAHWWLACRAWRLFQPFNTGEFELERWPVVAAALGRSLIAGDWHGAQFLLLALPFLLAIRGLRAAALVLMAQLGFYLYIYMSAPIDPAFSVGSTFRRFVLHLLPALLVAVVVAGERLVRRLDSCDPSAP